MPHDTTIEIWANHSFQLNAVEIAIVQHSKSGRQIAAPITMVSFDDVGQMLDPTMRLSRNEATMLMDELWRCGVRPSERVSGIGDTGTLGAKDAHLNDMRQIAKALLRDKGLEL